MQPPTLPIDEEERLQELYDLQILDTPPEPDFDAIVAVAARICQAPIALISLIDRDRQWFKARHGIDAPETSRAVSFCGHALHERDHLVVHDATLDPRFVDNPLVTGPPEIRFYAGVLLRAEGGRPLGTLCVIDRAPREPSAELLANLHTLSLAASNLFALRQRQRRERALLAAQDAITLDLGRATELLRRLADAKRDFLGGAPRDRVFHGLLDALLVTTASEYGFIGEVHRDPSGAAYLKTAAISNIAWSPETRRLFEDNHRRGLVFSNHYSLFGHVLRTSEPVITNDPASDPRRGGTPPGHPPLRAFLGVPCLADGELVGMFGIANRPGGYSRRDLDELAPLQATCAAIFANIRAQRRREEAERGLLERQADLARVNGELAEALRVKDEFLATVSHELRTPLQGLLGLASTLAGGRHGALTPAQQGVLETMNASGHLLLQLINDLLDFTKAESGQLALGPGVTDLPVVLDQCLDLLRDQAHTKGLSLTRAVDPGFPRLALDPLRVLQILLNLLSNAVKFTDRGAVAVHARAPAEGPLRIEVRDTGIGISPADLARIFAPFTQIDSGLKRRRGGTGLGLALSRRIAALFGGAIEVESALGRGSTFSLTIPRAHALAAAAPAPAPTPALAPASSPHRILLAEDNDINVLTLSAFLEEGGHSVVVAHDGEEAIHLAAAERPDLILMDLHMPRVDGLEATRRIRRDPALRGVPILALTAAVGVDDRRRGADARRDAGRTKPITSARLNQTIAEHLRDRP